MIFTEGNNNVPFDPIMLVGREISERCAPYASSVWGDDEEGEHPNSFPFHLREIIQDYMDRVLPVCPASKSQKAPR